MKRLMLTTVSVIALGLGGLGVSYAAGDNAGSVGGSTSPSMNSPMQHPNAMGPNPASSGTSSAASSAGISQPAYNNNPAETGTGNWGMNGHMDRRAELREVQQKLQQEGLYHGNIDGIMGRETHQALRQYQQQNGLRVTAGLDRQTLDHLLGNSSFGQGSSSPNMAPHQASGNTPNHSSTGK